MLSLSWIYFSPDNVVAASHMAEALMSQGKVDETVSCLREILEKRSSSPLRVLLGKAFYMQVRTTLHLLPPIYLTTSTFSQDYLTM